LTTLLGLAKVWALRGTALINRWLEWLARQKAEVALVWAGDAAAEQF
jgi:hypothetical protein